MVEGSNDTSGLNCSGSWGCHTGAEAGRNCFLCLGSGSLHVSRVLNESFASVFDKWRCAPGTQRDGETERRETGDGGRDGVRYGDSL